MKIEISEINVNPGRREGDLTKINELARSISEVGLLNPITIDPDHTLIAGLHRLEAAKRLGWTVRLSVRSAAWRDCKRSWRRSTRMLSARRCPR